MRDEEKVAKPPQLAQTGWCGQELFDHTTPSAPQRRLRYFFLVSRPPLLLLRRGGRDTLSSLSRVQSRFQIRFPSNSISIRTGLKLKQWSPTTSPAPVPEAR